MNKIYILLPVHNRKNITFKFIQGLKNQSRKDYKLVLIDDGSSDHTDAMVRENIDNVDVIRGTGHWWWAECLNQGINHLFSLPLSGEDTVVIINDDVEIDDEFLDTGNKLVSSYKKSLVLAQILDHKTGKPTESGIHVNFQNMEFRPANSPDEINCLSTRGLFIKWRDIREIGYFKSRLLPHYFSDYEFTIRAYKKGYKLITSSSLYISYKRETTGMRRMGKGSLIECCKQLFSTRFSRNPVYWSNLVILICPWQSIVPNLIRIWLKSLISLQRCSTRT